MKVIYLLDYNGMVYGSDAMLVAYDRKTTRLTKKVIDQFKRVAKFKNIDNYNIHVFIDTLSSKPIKTYKGGLK